MCAGLPISGQKPSRKNRGKAGRALSECDRWPIEPNVGRVADGVQGRIHRLKGLGNAIIPQIAEEIGKAIVKAEYGD